VTNRLLCRRTPELARAGWADFFWKTPYPPTSQIQKSARLFNYLVGEGEQFVRNSQAERLGGLEVDDELESGGLHDRKVERLLALEDAPT
jgi:hypothetical protein